MNLTATEENYIKAIFHCATEGDGNVTTNEISDSLKTTAASVTDMLKKLSEKQLVTYEKYYGRS